MEIRGGSTAVAEAVSTPGIDAWVFSQPYEGAASGGDVHYLSLCGGGIITRLIVADVSGHGASVAEFSNSLRTLMRRNINTKSQTRLVRSLNRQFAELAQMRRFATAVVATYLATNQSLTVCNAGHPRPLWWRAETGTWMLLDLEVRVAGNLPLGLDDETAYHQFAVILGRGDLVLFYTDALIEAADASGVLLGEEGLLSLVRGIEPDGPADLGRSLLEAVARHRDGRPADDDVTLVALHHNASGPRALSIGEKIDVYAKVFGLKAY
jgi:serine phosphatase RsbU (regulator of sigma subunit)